jgi:hypothetical protein
MDVEIGKIVSTVRAVDGGSALSAEGMQSVVAAVLQAVEAKEAHDSRVRAERRVTAGVRSEQVEE